MDNVASCVTFLFLSEVGFLSHRFGYKYVRKPIKTSMTGILAYFSKNVGPKMVPWIGPQGIDKVGQKFENAPPL